MSSESPDNQSSTATKILRTHKVVLFNDENHTYNYVVELLTQTCKLSKDAAFRCAVEVDISGRSVVYYGQHSDCIDRMQRIISFGPDHRLPHSMSSMGAQVEES